MSAPFIDHLPYPDEDLALPVQGLFADLEAGTGAVVFDDGFDDATPLVRLRVLKAWADDIERHQRAALQALYREFGHHDLPPAARMERFVRYCAWIGIPVPPGVLDGTD